MEESDESAVEVAQDRVHITPVGKKALKSREKQKKEKIKK